MSWASFLDALRAKAAAVPEWQSPAAPEPTPAPAPAPTPAPAPAPVSFQAPAPRAELTPPMSLETFIAQNLDRENLRGGVWADQGAPWVVTDMANALRAQGVTSPDSLLTEYRTDAERAQLAHMDRTDSVSAVARLIDARTGGVFGRSFSGDGATRYSARYDAASGRLLFGTDGYVTNESSKYASGLAAAAFPFAVAGAVAGVAALTAESGAAVAAEAVATEAATAGALDLGGGLSMTASGEILGGTGAFLPAAGADVAAMVAGEAGLFVTPALAPTIAETAGVGLDVIPEGVAFTPASGAQVESFLQGTAGFGVPTYNPATGVGFDVIPEAEPFTPASGAQVDALIAGTEGIGVYPTTAEAAGVGQDVIPEGEPFTPASGAQVDALIAGTEGIGVYPTTAEAAGVGQDVIPEGEPFTPASGAQVDALIAGNEGIGVLPKANPIPKNLTPTKVLQGAKSVLGAVRTLESLTRDAARVPVRRPGGSGSGSVAPARSSAPSGAQGVSVGAPGAGGSGNVDAGKAVTVAVGALIALAAFLGSN